MVLPEVIDNLLRLRGKNISLLPVLGLALPDHAHWKEKTGEYPFDPKKDLYKWLFSAGILHFAALKLLAGRLVSVQEASRIIYQRYFLSHGIDVEVIPFPGSTAFLDYHTGARVNSKPESSLWPAMNAIRLFPEVDFKISFDSPYTNGLKDVFILVNTTKVEKETYNAHLLGYWGEPDEFVNITKGAGYLRRVNNRLNSWGTGLVASDLVIGDSDHMLIQALLG